MPKVPFAHFSSFMNDKHFWSNWTIQMSPDDDERYFIECWAMARSSGSSTAQSFDFTKTNVILLSKSDFVSWELDGEHISKFFEKWYRGEVR